MVIHGGLPPEIDQPVDEASFRKAQTCRDVFRKRMICTHTWSVHFTRGLYDRSFQWKTLHDMDNISPCDSLLDNGLVDFGKTEAIGTENRFKYRDLKMSEGKIRLDFLGIVILTCHDAYVQSLSRKP
jgi:hypothetical protein